MQLNTNTVLLCLLHSLTNTVTCFVYKINHYNTVAPSQRSTMAASINASGHQNFA